MEEEHCTHHRNALIHVSFPNYAKPYIQATLEDRFLYISWITNRERAVCGGNLSTWLITDQGWAPWLIVGWSWDVDYCACVQVISWCCVGGDWGNGKVWDEVQGEGNANSGIFIHLNFIRTVSSFCLTQWEWSYGTEELWRREMRESRRQSRWFSTHLLWSISDEKRINFEKIRCTIK